MITGRRYFLAGLSGIAVVLAGAGALLGGQQQEQGDESLPHFPADPPDSPPGPPPIPGGPRPRPYPKALLKENEKNMKRDVDQLVDLAQQLKTDVDKTNETDVLSLPLIRRAEEIEKLAKQIRSMARAS